MPYLADLNTYLHQSSLLLSAYPDSRITTKYSLPRKPKPNAKRKPKAPASADDTAATTTSDPSAQTTQTSAPAREKREPSATLTLKTFHPGSGICLKYKTDKAQEVGRLMNGLGRLARGEEITMPTMNVVAADGDKMEVDSGTAVAVKSEDAVVTGKASGEQTQQQQGGGGGGKKKKKGKK